MKWLSGIIATILVLSACDCGGGKSDSDAKWLDLEIDRPEIEEPAVRESRYGEIGENTLLTTAYLGAARFNGARSIKPPIDILRDHGIEFGPDTWVRFDPGRTTMRVRQRRAQLEKLDELIYDDEREVSFQFEIFEIAAGDALRLEQSAAGHSDHSSEHEAVLRMVRDHSARVVTSATLKSRSGQRTEYEDAEEIRYVGGFKEPVKDEPGPPLPAFEVMKVGTVAELEADIGPDNRIVDVNLHVDHHLKPPVWPAAKEVQSAVTGSRAPQFHIGSIDIREMILEGRVKLICSWTVPASPGQKPRLSRLLFIGVTSIR